MPAAAVVEVTNPTMAGRATSGPRWAYLGTSVRGRARVRSRLGADREWPLLDRLDRATDRLRRPFLAFVAKVGRAQANPLSWWCTGFSWKHWVGSDLFLLIGYQAVAHELIDDAAAEGVPTVVVVEDPWLLRQLADDFAGRPAAHVSGVSALWPRQVAAVWRGLAHRTWWLLKIVGVGWTRHQLTWRRRAPGPPQRPTIALYTAPHRRCLRPDGGWNDPFLPRLDRVAEELGYAVVRVTAPDWHGLERELAARRELFRPLWLYATPAAVWRALTVRWRPHWPQQMRVAGRDVSWLARREASREAGRASMCVPRLLHECARRMFARGAWAAVVWPFENQPWEKMLTLAARAGGVRTIGMQHAAIGVNFMSLWRAPEEPVPLPEALWTSGSYAHRLLVEGGHEPDRLRPLGSLRYQHLLDDGVAETVAPAPRSRILVALPIDPRMSEHLLAALREAFPDAGRADGLEFVVKPHPHLPLDAEAARWPALRAPAAFAEAIAACGTVITVGSAVAPEALALGRAVIRFVPERLINVDPSEAFAQLPIAHDSTLRRTILQVVAGQSAPIPTAEVRRITAEIFGRLDEPGVRALFGSAAGRPSGGAVLPAAQPIPDPVRA